MEKFKNNIWVVSDLHLFCKGIFRHSRKDIAVYDCNGEIDLEESKKQMHERIIEEWNKVIQPDDMVIDLGDVCHSTATIEMLTPIFERLNGQRILLPGNHDLPIIKKDKSFFNKLGYKNIEAWIDIMQITNKELLPKEDAEIKNSIGFQGVVFSHEPMAIIPAGYINIHGHIHEGKSKLFFWIDDRRINASLDTRDYKPLLLYEGGK